MARIRSSKGYKTSQYRLKAIIQTLFIFSRKNDLGEFDLNRREATIKRISEQMELQGIKPKELTQYLGLPDGTYNNWKRDKGYLYMLYLEEISEYLNVSISYLVTGKEEWVSETDSNHVRKQDEIELLRVYNSLSLAERRCAHRILRALG